MVDEQWKAAAAASPSPETDTGLPGAGRQAPSQGLASATPARLLSDLAADADRSSRYHQRRRSFFDASHRWAMFGVIVSGSAGFAAVAGNPEIFGALSAAIGAADLLWDFSGRARDHEMLHRRLVEVLQRIGGVPFPTIEIAGEVEAMLGAIYADEPPIYRALNADCHNQVAQSRQGDRAELLYLSWWQRLTMNLLRYSNLRLRVDDRSLQASKMSQAPA